MRIREAIHLSSKKFDFLGRSDFSLNVLFPVVVDDENFVNHEILTREEYSRVLDHILSYNERYKMYSDQIRYANNLSYIHLSSFSLIAMF
jgi:hypothetical protein